MPRLLDVVLRDELAKHAKAGCKCVFTGAFVVVPDVSVLELPGGIGVEMVRRGRQVRVQLVRQRGRQV